jgi:hypothetical protein
MGRYLEGRHFTLWPASCHIIFTDNMQRYANFKSAGTNVRLKIAFYYVQRIVTSRTVRNAVSHILVGALKKLHGNKMLCSHYKTSLAEHLGKAGYIELGKLLSKEQCQEMHCYLRDQTMIDVRGTGSVFKIDEVPDGVTLADYPLDTVVNCPNVLDVANRPELLNFIASYLRYKPTIANIGLRWSFPGGSSGDQVQSFHRDAEAGTAKVLIYLTDVDNGSGPHAYVEGTHRDRVPLRLRTYSNEEIARRYGSSVHIMGCAGTGFAIDTKGIHRGVPPTQRPRLLLVIQYSLLPSMLYDYVPVKCVKARQFDPYINRLIIVDGEGAETAVHYPATGPMPALHK